MDTPQNQYLPKRRRNEAVFVTKAGKEYQRNVSVAVKNAAGANFKQIVAGTVLGQWHVDDRFYPIAKDAAQAAVSSANVIEVEHIYQFKLGDMVELPMSVAKGADRFRKVTAIDETNDTITVDGSSFSLSKGDVIEVDRTRSFDSVQDAGTTTSNQVSVVDASLFEVGDRLDIGPATASLTFTVTDGSKTDEYNITVDVFDADRNKLATLVADFEAATDDDDAIATELESQLQQALDNADVGDLGEASVTTGAGSTVTVTFADPTFEFQYNLAGTGLTATEDDSTNVTVTAVDTGTNKLTVSKTLTFSNGEQVVSDPDAAKSDGEYLLTEQTVNTDEVGYTPQNVLALTRPRGVVRRELVHGLTDEAKAHLERQMRFTDV